MKPPDRRVAGALNVGVGVAAGGVGAFEGKKLEVSAWVVCAEVETKRLPGDVRV